jgi:hypothetical protein
MLLRLPLMLLVLLLLVQLLCCTTMLLCGIVCHVLLLLLRRQVTHGHTVLLQALQICKNDTGESLLRQPAISSSTLLPCSAGDDAAAVATSTITWSAAVRPQPQHASPMMRASTSFSCG